MLGHTSPEMLFTVYARFIPNKTRREGSAFLARLVEDVGQPIGQNPIAIRQKYGRYGEGEPDKDGISSTYDALEPNLPLGRQGHKVANIGEAAAAAIFFVVNPESGGQGFRAGDARTA